MTNDSDSDPILLLDTATLDTVIARVDAAVSANGSTGQPATYDRAACEHVSVALAHLRAARSHLKLAAIAEDRASSS